MAKQLLIGVTGPNRRLKWAWMALRWRLWRLGVAARYLPPDSGYPADDFDGFIVSGGNDIDPAIYGGDMSESPSVDPIRDAFELEILNEADRRRLPVLGICRGMQLMNVHAGGSLFSDLKPYRRLTSNRATLLPRKELTVRKGSLLHHWIGRTDPRVNSLHHQAVNSLGDGFAVAARDRDGIIQSIERDSGPLRLGVQWHPEYLPQRPEQRLLFSRFIARCGDVCSRRRVPANEDQTFSEYQRADGNPHEKTGGSGITMGTTT